VVGNKSVFVVRRAEEVRVLVAKSTHLGEPLHWCIREHVFYDPRIGGDRWDVYGRKLEGSGPAPRDLDAMAARVQGSRVVVQTNPLLQGRLIGVEGGQGVATTEYRAAVARGDLCSEALPPVT
jgi:hypothetical protein